MKRFYSVLFAVILLLPLSACAGSAPEFKPTIRETYSLMLEPVAGTDDAFRILCVVEKKFYNDSGFSVNTMHLPAIPIRAASSAEACYIQENPHPEKPAPMMRTCCSLLDKEVEFVHPRRGISRKVVLSEEKDGKYRVGIFWYQSDGILEVLSSTAETELKPGEAAVLFVREY